MIYENIFLDYMSESKEVLHQYMEDLEQLIEKKINHEFPYITGRFDKNLKEFLENKQLNNFPQEYRRVLEDISSYFSETTRWHHPYVMNNIKTPVNLLALAVIYNTLMYDPNLAGDTNCGQMAFAELEVIKYIADLIGWNWEKSGGYFTFGGTSTILNAVKVGLNKCLNDACDLGVKQDVFIVSSEQGHSAHADVCNWLGIGKKNCIRVPVNENYQMDIKKAENIISNEIESGKQWAGIIGCGGTTIQTIVDPLYEIYKMRERIVARYNLPYLPHFHVDSVVGWVWLFYNKYSFEKNRLELSQRAIEKLQNMSMLIKDVKFADSIGIDFHKTGFCPYASSLFIAKEREDVYALNGKKSIPIEQIEYGNYSPSTYTLELSRSATGSISALTSLKLFGIEGYQKLLGDIIEGVCSLVEELEHYGNDVEVINSNTNGTCILFIIKPVKYECSYVELPEAKEEVTKEIAYYNYKFYLFVLHKIQMKEINFFIDYSSGYEKLKRGFHMGVLKMQTFNPMLTKEKAKYLAKKILCLKKEFEFNMHDFEPNYVYKPKTFKLTYKNNIYELKEEKVCLKK